MMNLVDGLRAAGSRYGQRIASVGVDTWGVDFGLLGSDDRLLGSPVCYRDARTNGIFEKALKLGEDSPAVREQVADYFHDARQPERARATAEEALSLAPGRGPSIELLGDSLLALGEVSAAREQYRIAYDISRDRRLWRKLDDLEPRTLTR